MRILVVEDDPPVAQKIFRALSAAGYAVDWASRVSEADTLVAQEPYEAAVLELGVSDGNGLDLLKSWRRRKIAIPVLALVVRDDWRDKVATLHAGADDCVSRSIHREELVARLQVLIRRVHRIDSGHLEVNGYLLDENTRTVCTPPGKQVSLTPTEFRLLRILMQNRDRILSKTQLFEQLYSLADAPDSNLVESYIKFLRAKIGKNAINTLRGQGYIFPSRAPIRVA